MPIREISRRTGLSRNTIRKYLRVDIVEPSFQTPKRPSKLDPFTEKLSGWLMAEQRKSRKDRRTAKQMHADLVKLGFDGSYERVAAFVRAWKADRQQVMQTTGRGTFVPLVFQPGEAFQFDWSEDWATMTPRAAALAPSPTSFAQPVLADRHSSSPSAPYTGRIASLARGAAGRNPRAGRRHSDRGCPA